MTLFEIFTEYRSGNTAALDTLLDNSDLKGMARKTYKNYSNRRNIEKTKTTKIYTGNEDDVRMLFAMQFLDMLEDKDYNPKNQQQLCTNLKYKAGGKVRNELVDDYVALDYRTDKKDEEKINLLDKIAYVRWSNDNNVGYCRTIKQLITILGRVNMCELLCGGADFQRRLVHLINKR